MSVRLNHLGTSRIIREQGRTVTDVASAIGVDRPNLAHMLAGRRQFPTEKIRPLAEHLGVNPYELLGPDDPRAAVAELARMFEISADELVGRVPA